MDDLQIWLYVIIGVAYLLSQVRKKSKQGLPQETAPPPKTPSARWKEQRAAPKETQKPMSFEDLLREITEAKTVSASPEYEQQEIDYEDYEEEVKPVLTKSGFDYRDADNTYRQFEEAKFRDYTKHSLEDTLKLENVDMKFGKFKEFEGPLRSDLLNRYTSDLQDPEGLRKAFVLSEVLRPRYF